MSRSRVIEARRTLWWWVARCDDPLTEYRTGFNDACTRLRKRARTRDKAIAKLIKWRDKQDAIVERKKLRSKQHQWEAIGDE